MKILMQNRYDALRNKGGDSYHMLYTKKYLEKEGIAVDVSTDLTPDLKNYDIVHLFNITRVHETYLQFKNAVKNRKKIVLSPIYHSMGDIRNYEIKNLNGLHGWLIKNIKSIDTIQLMKTMYYVHKYPEAWYSWIIQFYKSYTGQQKEVLRNADYLLPNSEMEMDAIRKELFDKEDIKLKYDVVYYGVEIGRYRESPKIKNWLNEKSPADYAVCAGRIEPRKNQIKIIHAVEREKIPVVFAGRINNLHASYGREFLALVKKNPNLFYLGELKQDEMMTLYKYAKVALLASWFETVGLIGLEGGAMGCNVVITEKGYTREYYKDFAWYCNPEDINSIRQAMLPAYKSVRGSKNLLQHIQNMEFNWEKAAKKTLEVYKKLI